MLLELSKIRRDGGTQPREYTSDVTVVEYSEAMTRGDQFPAVRVVYDGRDYWLVDGFHRIEAAEEAGLAEFEAEILQGTQVDAQWMSFGVNASHGMRRTAWDVRRAITAALQHPMSSGLSDRAIAEHIKCDHKTVGAQRKKLEEAGEVPQSDTRVGKDGRAMNTAAINANRGTSNSPTPEPDDEIQEPEGGWPEPNDDGTYDTELAEPVFCNKGHAQAVIHVLRIQPLAWRRGERWIANAAITGVPGCELATPLCVFEIVGDSRGEVIRAAAQEIAEHILRCARDESLLASRHATLLWFLDWAIEQGADRVEAEEALAAEDRRRDERYVGIAEGVVFGLVALTPNEYRRDEELFGNWGRIVLEMMKFAGEEVEGQDEMRALIDQVDEVEARFAAVITAIREHKAREIAA